MNNFHIRLAFWQKDNAALRHIRETVFVNEQAIPAALEWDAEDSNALHFLAYDDDYPIGTARLLPDGHIGRLSVLKDWRGLHVGDRLLKRAIVEAEQLGLTRQMLSAQVEKTAFYERFGFKVVSGEYLDAGLPHIDMLRESPK